MLEKAKQIKAIFFDIDSTLFDHTLYDFPLSTKETLTKLFDAKYRIYIATSRSEEEMIHVWDKIDSYPFHGIITCGGAMSRVDGELIDHKVMEEADALVVMAFCREHQIDVRWQAVGKCFFDAEAKPFSKGVFDYLYQMVPEVQRWNQEELVNLLLYTSKEQAEEVTLLIQNSSIVHYSDAIELTGPDVNKASAIAKMALRDGFTMDEVATFGDGENDEQMLRMAGIGIAMGNGVEVAKQAADFITKSIDEDGIAYACQYLGFISS